MVSQQAARIGRRIRERRLELGLTQRKVADDVGKVVGNVSIDGNAVSRWERGEHRPGDQTLEAIAEVLGLTPADLIAGPVSERQPKGETPDPFSGNGQGTQLDRIETMLAEVLDLLRPEDDRAQMERLAGPGPEIAEPRKTRAARSSR